MSHVYHLFETIFDGNLITIEEGVEEESLLNVISMFLLYENVLILSDCSVAPEAHCPFRIQLLALVQWRDFKFVLLYILGTVLLIGNPDVVLL